MPEDFRAVCRIDTPVGGSYRRGSGFLISPERVLTAAHVVSDPADGKKRLEGADKLDVTFARTAAADPVLTYKGTVEQFNARHDWSVVRLDGAPPLQPFKLGPLRPVFPTPWNTYGFSRDAKDAGQAYAGHVRTFVGDFIQLYVEESAAEEGITVAGLSGSPVLVGGYAVAIVSSTQETKTELPKGGKLYAVRIETMVLTGATGLDLPLTEPLFFSPPVLGMIPVVPGLPEAAGALGLPRLGPVDAELARDVARVMLRAGVVPTQGALKVLVGPVTQGKASMILRFCATAWIAPEAAAALWTVVSDSTRDRVVILLNAESHHVGDWYGLRSRCHRTGTWPGEKALFLAVTRPDDLLNDLRQQLSVALNCALEDVAAKSKTWDYGKQPIVAVVKGLPAPEMVTAAHDAFPRVKLLLCVGPSLDDARARFPAADLVHPLIPVATAEDVVSAYEAGLDDLEWAYRELGQEQ